jgi:DNA-binding transcriptional regulator GbsR (MarR family)
MHDAVAAFIEQMGLVSEANGLSRIAGRMIGLLLVDGRTHSLDEIVERLRVSKGSVSTNARMLEQHGIIERQSVAGDRRDYYRIGDRPWEQMLEMIRQRMRRTLRAVEKGLDEIPEDLADARHRLETWHGFYSFLLDDFEHTPERWARWLAEHPARATS